MNGDVEYMRRTAERGAVHQAITRRRDEQANTRIAMGEGKPDDVERVCQLLEALGVVSEAVRDGTLEDDELLDLAARAVGWLEDRVEEAAA